MNALLTILSALAIVVLSLLYVGMVRYIRFQDERILALELKMMGTTSRTKRARPSYLAVVPEDS